MIFRREIKLENGAVCILSNLTVQDASESLRCFIKMHDETEFLASYADESTRTPESEASRIEIANASPNALELCASVDGRIIAKAGLHPVSHREKAKHRATLGISVEKAYWNLGIGRAMTEACIECAKQAGYLQLELEVVSANTAAVHLYESLGFQTYGRNPLGFRTRSGQWQELLAMRLELCNLG